MLKKVGQLVLAVTKWLQALSLCSLVSSLPPLAPSLLELEVVDETHEMVSEISENGEEKWMDEVYGVFGRCFVKGSRWFGWWRVKKNGDVKPRIGLGVRTVKGRPDGYTGSGIPQGFWERKEWL